MRSEIVEGSAKDDMHVYFQESLSKLVGFLDVAGVHFSNPGFGVEKRLRECWVLNQSSSRSFWFVSCRRIAGL